MTEVVVAGAEVAVETEVVDLHTAVEVEGDRPLMEAVVEEEVVAAEVAIHVVEVEAEIEEADLHMVEEALDQEEVVEVDRMISCKI